MSKEHKLSPFQIELIVGAYNDSQGKSEPKMPLVTSSQTRLILTFGVQHSFACIRL